MSYSVILREIFEVCSVYFFIYREVQCFIVYYTQNATLKPSVNFSSVRCFISSLVNT